MKPRKPNETDAEYIARLEHALHDTKRHNEMMRKAQDRLYRTVVPAGSQAGLVVQAAAEMTGTLDDPEVRATIAAFQRMAECGWNASDEVIVVPPLPTERLPEPTFGGDIEMILKSAVERVKSEREPWADHSDVMPRAPKVVGPEADWDDIRHEIYDALTDLEIGRKVLRLDLRSTMFDYCMGRIMNAVAAADEKQRAEQPERPHPSDGDAVAF